MIRDNRGGGAERQGEEAWSGERFTQQAKEAAHEVAEQAKKQAGDVARKMRDSGEQVLEEQKNRFAKICGDVGRAMRQAHDKLEEQGDHTLASYVRAAADRSEAACHYIEQRSSRDLIRQAQDFAARRPEIVLGAMFLIGLATARLLKASSHQRSHPADRMPEEDEEVFDAVENELSDYTTSDDIYPETGAAQAEAGGLPGEPVQLQEGYDPPAHFAQPDASDVPAAQPPHHRRETPEGMES